MTIKKHGNARELAFQILGEIEKHEKFAHLAVPAALDRSTLDIRERALVTELTYGTIRRRLSLDYLIARFSEREIATIDYGALDLLRLGIYQLVYMDKIPDHAAVDSSVVLAKEHLRPGLEKFINAILRRTARERAELPWPDRNVDQVRFLSVYYSHPRWLVELWWAELGPKETEALLIADNERPRVTLRANTLKTNRAQLLSRLREADAEAHATTLTTEGIIVVGSTPNTVFNEGLAYAQDESSIIVSHVLAPLPGETVVEFGAGPGGKTTHLAQLMENSGRILAVDIKQSRLGLVSENCRRLGVDIVQTVLLDPTQPPSSHQLPAEPLIEIRASADRVLVDAPCSGLGVLARRADARWRKTPEMIVELAELQERLLDQAAQFAKAGGILVYSVCTITRAETTEVVDSFLRNHPNFELMPFAMATAGLEAPAGELRLFPQMHGTDGMFIAKLRRRI